MYTETEHNQGDDLSARERDSTPPPCPPQKKANEDDSDGDHVTDDPGLSPLP